MTKRIVFGFLMLMVLLASVSVVDARDHGRRGHGGRRSGYSYQYRYQYRVPTRQYRQYYYAPAPVYVPRAYYGPPTVHHPGLLDYVIVLPLKMLFGHDEVVPPPPTPSARQEKSDDPTPPLGWQDRGSKSFQEESLDDESSVDSSQKQKWDINIDSNQLEVLKEYFSTIHATDEERDAFSRGFSMIRGKSFQPISPREIEALRSLRRKLLTQVSNLAELDALIKFAEKVGANS